MLHTGGLSYKVVQPPALGLPTWTSHISGHLPGSVMLNDACPPDKLCILLGAPAALDFCHAVPSGALSVKGTLAVRSGLWPGGSAAREAVKPPVIGN